MRLFDDLLVNDTTEQTSASPLSLVVITKNEERNIVRCLESCSFVDETLVLDSESTDQTREIAEKMGAVVFNEPFRGFRDQKQRAIELAKNDWVLSLDADEALSEELVSEIQEWRLGEPTADAYSLPRKSWHLGRWINHGGWYPDRQIRLFHRKKVNWGEGSVHEKIQTSSLKKLKSPILHWVFRDLHHQIETNNRYSGLGAEDLFESGKKFNLIHLISRPTFKFLEVYIMKRGFLDGIPGFIIAIGAAYSMFLRYGKLWEKTKVK